MLDKKWGLCGGVRSERKKTCTRIGPSNVDLECAGVVSSIFVEGGC